jgi:hypothetical protein
MAETAETRGTSARLGPAFIYKILLAAAGYLPLLYFFSKSWFAMSVITALTICLAFLSTPFRTDLSVHDWRTFYHYPIWIMRAVALAIGYWLFVATPSEIGRFIAVLIYAVLYGIGEYVAWHSKPAAD